MSGLGDLGGGVPLGSAAELELPLHYQIRGGPHVEMILDEVHEFAVDLEDLRVGAGARCIQSAWQREGPAADEDAVESPMARVPAIDRIGDPARVGVLQVGWVGLDVDAVVAGFELARRIGGDGHRSDCDGDDRHPGSDGRIRGPKPGVEALTRYCRRLHEAEDVESAGSMRRSSEA